LQLVGNRLKEGAREHSEPERSYYPHIPAMAREWVAPNPATGRLGDALGTALIPAAKQIES